MPDVYASLVVGWADGATLDSAPLTVSWRDGSSVDSVGGAYTPPAAPPGSTPTAPQAPVIPTIPDLANYAVVHTASVVDLRDGSDVEFESLTISTDEDSLVWTLRAQAGAGVFQLLTTGDVPELEATIDGVAWRFAVDSVSRSRSIPRSTATIVGRSLTIAAGSPWQIEQQWTVDYDTTAAQIASYANLYTGVSVDWQIPDWFIPATVFSHSGTPLDVVRRVAETVGAIVQSDPLLPLLRVTPRYALLPNEWPSAVPDVEIALDVAITEAVERADQPAYSGVYVSGQQSGAIGLVRLAGTTGGYMHPLITDLLITDQTAVEMRGFVTLAKSGKQANVTLTLPFLAGGDYPGALRPGQLVRVPDPDGTWVGRVRSVSIAVTLPTVRQTVVLERHVEAVEGTVVVPDPVVVPLAWSTIPAQTVRVGDPLTVGLSAYHAGGTGPFTYALRSGTLPPGVTLDAATGVVSGTSEVDGAWGGLSARVIDGEYRQADSGPFTITVTSAAQRTFFFGQSPSAAKTVSGPAKTARDDFVAALAAAEMSVRSEGFETVAGTVALTLHGGTSTLTSTNPDGMSRISRDAAYGRFNATPGGNAWWETSESFTVSFATPVKAFGAYIMDVGDFEGSMQIQLIGSRGTESFPVALSGVASDGALAFIGFADTTAATYSQVKFVVTQALGEEDFIGVDEVMVGRRA